MFFLLADVSLAVKKPFVWLNPLVTMLFRMDYTFACLSPTLFRKLYTYAQSKTCRIAASIDGYCYLLFPELIFSLVRSEERARWSGEREERSIDVL